MSLTEARAVYALLTAPMSDDEIRTRIISDPWPRVEDSPTLARVKRAFRSMVNRTGATLHPRAEM